MKYTKGEIVDGLVTGIEDYGIFVSLDEYYTGLIHISEISNDYVRNINNYVNIGETIKVKILESNDELFQVKLSIKDINYRKRHEERKKIQETGTGFNILSNNLKKWINEKNIKKN